MFIRRKDYDPSLKDHDRGANPLGILMLSGDDKGIKITLAIANQKHGDTFNKHKGMARCRGLLDSPRTIQVPPANLEDTLKNVLSKRKYPVPFSSRIENFAKVFVRKVTDPFPPKAWGMTPDKKVPCTQLEQLLHHKSVNLPFNRKLQLYGNPNKVRWIQENLHVKNSNSPVYQQIIDLTKVILESSNVKE